MDATTARTTAHFCRRAALVIAAWLLPVVAAKAQGALPFGAGERLTYRVRVDKMRASGRGTMWIEGPAEVRGVSALLFRSRVEVGIGPIKAIDKSDSWFDPARMSALRFEQNHRYLFSRNASDGPARATAAAPASPTRRWTSSPSSTTSGPSPSNRIAATSSIGTTTRNATPCAFGSCDATA